MPSQYTPSLKLQEIANGEQSGIWGTTTNNNLTLIEQAVTGVVTINMNNQNYRLTNLNGVPSDARNAVIVATGTNSAIRQIIAPLAQKFYVVSNRTTGGFDITIGGSTGALVSIKNGVTAQVYCDGSDFYSAQTGSAGNFAVDGNLTVDGSLSASTADFSGAISSVSPTFTGVPTAPTAQSGTNTNQIATTEFVLSNSVPTGGLIMWATNTAPLGFLLCNGAAVSRTTYSRLFAAISTTFGTGDGSTTFNLPNYTNRMPYGTTIGATGGSADAIVVSHNHTGTTGGQTADHIHNFVTDPTNVPAFFAQSASGGPRTAGFTGQANTISVASYTAGTSNDHGHNFITNSSGSSGTNANLPPYLGINFIIKT